MATKVKQIYIFRCRNAGVHAGELVSKNATEIVIGNSRRLWKWVSRATLSELSQEGPLRKDENKYGCVVPKIILSREDVCEIIPCTKQAAKEIYGVNVWQA